MMRIHTDNFGFTLIELILSLTILAAVASIVLTTATELGERTRYEETERRGLMIQSAVVGTPDTPSRLAADLGRFPMVIDAAGGRELAELYDAGIATNDALGYATRAIRLTPSAERFTFGTAIDFNGTNNPLGDAEVTLGAGWRGPYLTWRYERLTDNWGNPWELFAGNARAEAEPGWLSSGDTIEPGTEILGIRTLGRDGEDESALGSTAPDTYPDEIQAYAFSSNALFATLTVQVWTNAAAPLCRGFVAPNLFLRVFLYQPACTCEKAGVCELAAWRSTNATDNGCVYRVQTHNETSPAVVIPRAADSPYAFLPTAAKWESVSRLDFTDVPAGVRKVWAYAYAPGGDHGLRSPLTAVDLRPGRTHLIDLYLTEPF